jgi:hypothetical protein
MGVIYRVPYENPLRKANKFGIVCMSLALLECISVCCTLNEKSLPGALPPLVTLLDPTTHTRTHKMRNLVLSQCDRARYLRPCMCVSGTHTTHTIFRKPLSTHTNSYCPIFGFVSLCDVLLFSSHPKTIHNFVR